MGKGEIARYTVGKGEIARYEQFLLFPQCFQKACFQGASKGVIVWEWVKKNYVEPFTALSHNLMIFMKRNCFYIIKPFKCIPILCSSNSAANEDMMSKI